MLRSGRCGGDSDLPISLISSSPEIPCITERGGVYYPPVERPLVEAARKGDRDAFAALVSRHLPRVVAVCAARVGRGPDLDDVAQETFLRAWANIRSLADPDRFGAWLYGIALRTCWEHFKTRRPKPMEEEPAVEFRPPDDEPARLWEALQSLPELYRETLLLFYVDRRSYQEIADALGVTRAAVNQRLTRARTMLRELVKA